MALVLRIENVDTLPDGGPVFFEIDRRGIDIGRDSYLDWTLPDPERFISGKHCEIHYRDGGYWLHDVSTNGTSINDRGGRLTEPYLIRHGDRINIGHYIIVADLSGDDSVRDKPALGGAGTNPNDPWGDVDDAAEAVSKQDFYTYTGPDNSTSLSLRQSDMAEEDISWGVGDVAPGAGEDVDWAVSPPISAAEDIDTNWATPAAETSRDTDAAAPGPDMREIAAEAQPSEVPPETAEADAPDLASSEVEVPEAEVEPVPAAPEAPGPVKAPSTGDSRLASQWADGAQPAPAAVQDASAPKPVAAPSGVVGGTIAAFERGAGLPPGAVVGRDDQAFAEELGALFRTITQSLQAMLLARAETKSAMRSSERTMIGAMENNPLKFSPTPEDALKIMFGAPSRSYLDAEQTVEQSFGDLQRHQLQTFGAMQQALQALIEDLDPQRIAGSTEKEVGLAGLVGSHRAKCWDTYVERFKAKSGRHERGMIDAFMILFSEMYDRQG